LFWIFKKRKKRENVKVITCILGLYRPRLLGLKPPSFVVVYTTTKAIILHTLYRAYKDQQFLYSIVCFLKLEKVAFFGFSKKNVKNVFSNYAAENKTNITKTSSTSRIRRLCLPHLHSIASCAGCATVDSAKVQKSRFVVSGAYLRPPRRLQRYDGTVRPRFDSLAKHSYSQASINGSTSIIMFRLVMRCLINISAEQSAGDRVRMFTLARTLSYSLGGPEDRRIMEVLQDTL